MNIVEFNRLTEELKKDKEVKAPARGVVALSLVVILLSAFVVFTGCKGGGGGPTGPSEDSCASLAGGNIVGKWRYAKTGSEEEYRSNGTWTRNGAEAGTYATEGNKMKYVSGNGAGSWTYFEVRGNELTYCYNGKSNTWVRA